MPNTRPMISIVMPAYNSGRTIIDAIRSVLLQTYPDFELVICNDCSSDDTVSKILSFDDRRIHLIHNAANAGEGAARDHAIDVAQGRWIAVLDADDMYEPERLEILVDVAKSHPECIIFDEVMECHDTPHGMRPWRKVRSPDSFPGSVNRTRPVAFADWILQQRTVMKPLVPAALIRDHGVRHSDKRCSADMEYFLALFARSRTTLWYVPRAMYLYRINPGSMSTVTDRHALTAATLTEAIPLFENDPATANALRTAAAEYQKKETYRQFFSGIRAFDIKCVARLAWKHPWVVAEFVQRSVKQVPYHVDRIRHGGSWRKRA